MSDCTVVDYILTAINSYTQDFGEKPEGILVGPDVAMHLWDHVREGMLVDKNEQTPPESIMSLKSPFSFYGLRVQVIAVEGVVTFPLPYKFIGSWSRMMAGADFNPELN